MAKMAMFTGVDTIKEVFRQTYEPDYAYSLSYSERGDPCFLYCGTDHQRGIDNFNAYVESLDEAGNDDLLYLRFHPLQKQMKFIGKQTPVVLVTPIRVHAIGENVIVNGVGEGKQNSVTWAIMSTLKDLSAKQQAFEEKITGLLDADEPEPVAPQPVDKTQQYFEMIIGVLKQPNVIENIQGFIKMINPNYNPPVMRPQPAISGVNETQMSGAAQAQQPAPVQGPKPLAEYTEAEVYDLNVSLNRLATHCQLDQDLKLLADMADNDPQTFNFLLKQLRK